MGNKLKEEIILVHDQFDRGINKVIGKVEELGNKQNFGGVQNGLGGILKGVRGLSGSFGSLIGAATKFAGALAGVSIGVNLVQEMQQTVAESVKLYQSAEGIMLAFQRLNKPGLLDKLREETHGTVDDINLMKQAIKFKDFNLDINQLGTYLAFAQQKAKDTGESIDYMVDSIVTGLGRQSVQILDNLGISATEIRNKMKEGGDMTNAVAEIIKDRMQESGDYIETAADRASRRQAELHNQMIEIGKQWQPLTESCATFWDQMKLSINQFLIPLAKALQYTTELSSIMGRYNDLGGDKTVNKLLYGIGNVKTEGQKQLVKNRRKSLENRIQEGYRALNKFDELFKYPNVEKAIKGMGKNRYLEAQRIVQSFSAKYGKGRISTDFNSMHGRNIIVGDIGAMKEFLSRFNAGVAAREAAGKVNNGGGGGGGHTPTYHSSKKVEYPVGSIGYYEDEISKLQQELKLQTNSDEIAKIKREIKDLQNQIDSLENPNQHLDVELEDYRKQYEPKNILPTQEELDKLKIPNPFEEWQNAQSDIDKIIEGVDMGLIGREKGKELIDGINSQLKTQGLKPIETKVDENDALQETGRIVDIFSDAFSTMGESLKMPELNVVGVIAQSIANIIYGFSEAMKNPVNGVGGVFTWIAASVAGLAQLTAMISQIKSIGSYANGGIIGGNSFAGDNLIARVNSGEMILNTNHQRNLFDMLKYGTANGVNNNTVKFVIQGKDLFGVLSNYNNRTSKIR